MSLIAALLMTASVVARAAPNINQKGLTGAWADPDTPGQGFMLETYPNLIENGTGYMIGTWYTYDTASGGTDHNRWYVFQDIVPDGESAARMTIYRSTGGVFNSAAAVETNVVGSATIRFDSCTAGRFDYEFDDGRSGSIPLARVMPSGPCGEDSSEPAFEGDFALSGTWTDVSTTAQGMVIEVNPVAANVLLGWYTFDAGESRDASSQRWFTAHRPYKPGARDIDLDLYESVGGSFDGTSPVTTEPVGTARLVYVSCAEAYFTYAFKSGSLAGRNGTMSLSRVAAPPTICSQ